MIETGKKSESEKETEEIEEIDDRDKRTEETIENGTEETDLNQGTLLWKESL